MCLPASLQETLRRVDVNPPRSDDASPPSDGEVAPVRRPTDDIGVRRDFPVSRDLARCGLHNCHPVGLARQRDLTTVRGPVQASPGCLDGPVQRLEARDVGCPDRSCVGKAMGIFESHGPHREEDREKKREQHGDSEDIPWSRADAADLHVGVINPRR